MALDADVLALLRIEVGDNQDFSDDDPHVDGQLGSLEAFYNSTVIGNQNILRTALAVWRKRRADYVERSADASSGGQLVNRSQRMKFLDRMVARYEMLVDTTFKANNQRVLSNYEANDDEGGEY